MKNKIKKLLDLFTIPLMIVSFVLFDYVYDSSTSFLDMNDSSEFWHLIGIAFLLGVMLEGVMLFLIKLYKIIIL